MTPTEALKIALKQENDSIQMYSQMAIDHPGLKDILTMLINEEFKHRKLIENKLAEMTQI